MEHQKLLKRKRICMAKGNNEQLAKVCKELADEYNSIGDHELAKNEYKNVSEIYRKLKIPMDYAVACRMVGEMCTMLGEHEESLTNMKIYLKIAKDQHSVIEEMKAHASLGRTYLTKAIQYPDNIDQNVLDLAQKEFTESLTICDRIDITNDTREMRARIFRNFGVIKEMENSFEEAENYMLRSIKIYDNHQLYDGLHEGYHTLGQMYVKKGDYKEAISTFNKALEIADRLSNKKGALYSSYFKKANILILLGEFTSAQQILIKAYKLKVVNLDEDVATTLRVVSALCQLEDDLVATSLTNYKKRKEIYEHMGDGCTNLKAFKKAIEFYHQMLDCAIKNGESGEDLLSVYVSLAQTYKDDKQYDRAYEYFKKELKISGHIPVEGMKTLLAITDILPKLNKPHERIVETFTQARKNAIAARDVHYEGKIINDYIVYLRNVGRKAEAQKLLTEPAFMEYEPSSESDTENEDRPQTPGLGDDIDLDKLVRELGEDDNSRKRKRFVVKRNNKGETQLHKACINGNVELVKKLLDQDHPVNERDYCGWLPIHEACCTGSIEIVKVLIEQGAWINDRDGEKCKGYTPLHSACSNGYLKLIEFMLNNGASALIQSDDGCYPVDILRKWGENEDFDLESQKSFDDLVKKMTTILQKAGRRVKKINEIETSDVYCVEGTETSVLRRVSNEKPRVSQSPKKTPEKSLGNLRRTVDFGDDLNEPSTSLSRHSSSERINFQRNSSFERIESPKNKLRRTSSSTSIENNACEEYKRAIQGLKNRHSDPKAKSPRSFAFVPDEDNDDWLEDDLNIQRKKRKQKDSSVRKNYLESTGIRRTSSNHSITSFDSDIENSAPTNDSFKRRKSQLSLLDSGFIRRSESPVSNNTSPVTIVDKITIKPYVRQQKLNSYIQPEDSGLDSPVSSLVSSVDHTPIQPIIRPILAVNVRVENKLFRIPVPGHTVNDLTIEWLATEASKRYYRQEGITPVLQLMTKEGAILMNEDPLSMVFISHTQAEEVQSNIISWNLSSLRERYMEACEFLKIDPSPYVAEQMEKCQQTQHLILSKNKNIRDQFPAIFRALQHQRNLQILEFVDVFVNNDAVKLLCNILPSLNELKKLDLSHNIITVHGLNYLGELCKNSKENILENLVELNLSFNVFHFGDMLTPLYHFFKHVKLRSLNLSACTFRENIFVESNLHLNLQYLDTIDLHMNDFNTDDIIKFCSFLNFKRLQKINFGFMRFANTSGIIQAIADNLEACETHNIKEINCDYCCVSDCEIWNLLRALKNTPVDNLSLKFNTEITSISLRRIMQHRPSFNHVLLTGCTKLDEYFEPFQISDPTNKYENMLKYMRISIHSKEVRDKLEEMWKKEWGEKAKFESNIRCTVILSVDD